MTRLGGKTLSENTDLDDIQDLNDLSQAYEFATVEEFENSLVVLPDGKAVNIKEYFAGSGGGGKFLYDSSSSEAVDDGVVFQGVMPGRIKRVDLSYIDADMYGGDMSTVDAFVIIQHALDHVTNGGTVSTKGFTGTKIIDKLIAINTPCTVVSGSWVDFKLADNSNVYAATANGNTGAFFRVNASDTTVKGFDVDCNRDNNFVTVLTVNWYFRELPVDDDFRVLRAIIVGQLAFPLRNVLIENNKFRDCSAQGIGAIGTDTSSTSIPELKDSELYMDNIVFRGNYISGGSRSGMYFIGGVINSLMEDNTAEDWGWTSFRLYLRTNNCDILNNLSITNVNVDPTKYENDEPTYPTQAFIGVRLGHGSRSPGTVVTSKVKGNTIIQYGTSLDRPLRGIEIENQVKDAEISGNTIRCTAPRSYTIADISFTLATYGSIYISSIYNIKVKNNDIITTNLAAISSSIINNHSEVGFIDINDNYISVIGKSAATTDLRNIYMTSSLAINLDLQITENTFEQSIEGGELVFCAYTSGVGGSIQLSNNKNKGGIINPSNNIYIVNAGSDKRVIYQNNTHMLTSDWSSRASVVRIQGSSTIATENTFSMIDGASPPTGIIDLTVDLDRNNVAVP